MSRVDQQRSLRSSARWMNCNKRERRNMVWKRNKRSHRQGMTAQPKTCTINSNYELLDSTKLSPTTWIMLLTPNQASKTLLNWTKNAAKLKRVWSFERQETAANLQCDLRQRTIISNTIQTAFIQATLGVIQTIAVSWFSKIVSNKINRSMRRITNRQQKPNNFRT